MELDQGVRLKGGWCRGMASVACGRLSRRVAIVTTSTDGQVVVLFRPAGT